MDAGYFHLAQIDTKRGTYDLALENINRSLVRNWHNHKARHLKTAILRKMGGNESATTLASESLDLDPFNFGVIYEQHLLGSKDALSRLKKLIRGNIHNYIEVALDYAWAGMYKEATALLDTGINEQEKCYPMAWYYRAWIMDRTGNKDEALRNIQEGEACPSDYCFPNQVEAVPALTLAMEMNPDGPMAAYYLGNFWYNARQYKSAKACFEKTAEINTTFPTVFRNLALVDFNKFNNKERALANMEKAFSLDTSDARILMELNQLYKKMRKSVDFRIELLDKYPDLVEERDDLYLEKIELMILKKQFKEAYELIMSRKFHPWEGGEGKVSGAYSHSILGLAEEAIGRNEYTDAIDLLQKAKKYPENLGEGKLPNAQENHINYLLGCAYDGTGQKDNAKHAWREGSNGLSNPVIAWYYNDQQPDSIFYQGMSLIKLKSKTEAFSRFNKLIDYGEKHIFDDVKIDYFAVSMPDLQIWEEDLDIRNKIHCYYMMALGYLGKGMVKKAGKYFKNVLDLDPAHSGAMKYWENRIRINVC